MNRRTATYLPPCHPRGLDPRPDRVALVALDGTAKYSIETGRTRLLVAGLVFALAFLVIGVRLVDVSLLNGGGALNRAAAPAADGLATGRADIVDRNGVVLATTLPAASLYADPRQVTDPDEAAARLSEVLPELSAAKEAIKLAGPGSFVWIKRNLTPRQQYEVNRLGIPGLYFRREETRVYPHGELMAHVVGFTDIDDRGLAGMEQAFDATLRGGHRPLQLSLDVRIQHILAEELAGAMDEFGAVGAAGLVLDADSGEVVAMVSLPSFNPDRPGAAPNEARFNRASLGVYEMGSVFKIFTTAMALDQGVVGLRDGYDVSEPIRVARYTIRDFKPKDRWLSIPEIFIYSSNIGTVHMAMDTGTAAQKTLMRDLGLSRSAAIELPEVGEPMVPSPWREINTMTISYGHGLAVSPVQLVGAVGAVVNGGALKPVTLVKRAPGERPAGRRVFSERTSQEMRWLMRLAVQQGTGRKADVPGYLVGGKTGTADKLAGRRYSRNARIASFVGAFPMDRPRFVVFAMVDEPKGNERTLGYATGGWVAAPVVRRVVERMGPLLGVRPTPPEDAAGIDRHLIPVSARGLVVASN